jgi:hypothetical protein
MRTHLLRLALAICAIGSLLVLSEQTALSVEGGLDPKGEPKGFKAGESERYAVWHSKNGWHIRTTTAQREHHFTGKIIVEGGTVEGLEPHDLEQKGKFADWWKLGRERHEIVIDFKTDRGIDGINFQVSKDAKVIRFNLHIDGKHHAGKIFIGRDNQHPEKDPFELRAHPGK